MKLVKVEGFLHGVNLGGWLSQCRHKKEHYETFITEEDIKQIVSWNLDHIRVPFDYELIQTEDGKLIEEGFAYLDRCVSWCKKYQIHLIFDLHKAAGYDFNNANTKANDLFQSESLKNKFIALWSEMASRYGKYYDFTAFELLNEIVEEENAQLWNQLSFETIESIRKTAPYTKIILGGICWNSVYSVALLDIPYDENIIYNFHCYEPMAFTHQRANWVPQLAQIGEIEYPIPLEEMKQNSKGLKSWLRPLEKEGVVNLSPEFFETIFIDAIRISSERNVPLYCGEYGVIDMASAQSTVRWFEDISQAFNKFGIGRAVWSYKEMDFGITEEHYKPVMEKIIKLL